MSEISLHSLRFAVVFLLFFAPTSQAEIFKCITQKFPEITSYFNSKDVKKRKKCKTPPVSVLAPGGQKIITQFSNDASKIAAMSTDEVVAQRTPKRKCSGSGGTVKVNGRVFNLDLAAINKKYCKRSGKITRGYSSGRHQKLARVNANFRRKISGYVTKTARKHGMDPAFVHAVISAESAYKPNATSHVGAMGLMQLMPFTAKRFGVRNAYDPYQNIDAGTRYLKILYKEFGSLELAAAGYNAGEGAVRKYNRSIPPYKETRKYVPKVMAYYRKYKKNRHLITAN